MPNHRIILPDDKRCKHIDPFSLRQCRNERRWREFAWTCDQHLTTHARQEIAQMKMLGNDYVKRETWKTLAVLTVLTFGAFVLGLTLVIGVLAIHGGR